MERLIRILIAIARFIEDVAERVRESAIDRLEQRKEKARAMRDRAIQARNEEWDREVRQHKERMKKIQQGAVQADEVHDRAVQATEEKINRIYLT